MDTTQIAARALAHDGFNALREAFKIALKVFQQSSTALFFFGVEHLAVGFGFHGFGAFSALLHTHFMPLHSVFSVLNVLCRIVQHGVKLLALRVKRCKAFFAFGDRSIHCFSAGANLLHGGFRRGLLHAHFGKCGVQCHKLSRNGVDLTRGAVRAGTQLLELCGKGNEIGMVLRSFRFLCFYRLFFFLNIRFKRLSGQRGAFNLAI